MTCCGGQSQSRGPDRAVTPIPSGWQNSLWVRAGAVAGLVLLGLILVWVATQ